MTTMEVVCISCQVEPALAGRATCHACQRARAVRARDSVRLGDVPDPTPEALAEIEQEEADVQVVEMEPDRRPSATVDGRLLPTAAGPLWQCDCGRTFATSAGLGGHRGHGCGTRLTQPATGTLPAHERLYELVDLAIGWSYLSEPQRQCATAVGQLPEGEMALVNGIADRLSARTTRIFDELRRGG